MPNDPQPQQTRSTYDYPGRVTSKCRICGCVDSNPCFDPSTGNGCYWIERDLCSACRYTPPQQHRRAA